MVAYFIGVDRSLCAFDHFEFKSRAIFNELPSHGFVPRTASSGRSWFALVRQLFEGSLLIGREEVPPNGRCGARELECKLRR